MSITKLRVLNNNSMKKHNRFSRIQAPSRLNNSSQRDKCDFSFKLRLGFLGQEAFQKNTHKRLYKTMIVLEWEFPICKGPDLPRYRRHHGTLRVNGSRSRVSPEPSKHFVPQSFTLMPFCLRGRSPLFLLHSPRNWLQFGEQISTANTLDWRPMNWVLLLLSLFPNKYRSVTLRSSSTKSQRRKWIKSSSSLVWRFSSSGCWVRTYLFKHMIPIWAVPVTGGNTSRLFIRA